MEKLNANKQHRQVIEVFNDYQKQKIQPMSSMIITETLKACTELQDLRCGSRIHQAVSSYIKTDDFILASLINLYSEWM